MASLPKNLLGFLTHTVIARNFASGYRSFHQPQIDGTDATVDLNIQCDR